MVSFSVKNQVRYRGSLVRHVRRDEKRYYSDVVAYGRQNLMLFPYHLSDVVVKGLLVTPFQYYSQMMEALMAQERSYDSLPNFTAADCEHVCPAPFFCGTFLGRHLFSRCRRNCRKISILSTNLRRLKDEK